LSSRLFLFVLLLLAVLVLWGIVPRDVSIPPERAQRDVERLELAIQAQGRQISGLQQRLDQISNQLAYNTAGALPGAGDAEVLGGISERLTALERLSEDLVQGRPVNVIPESGKLPARNLRDRGPQPVSRAVYTPNTGADEVYEADAGFPLHENSPEVISEVFHGSDVVALSDLHCKQSVCKVTYSKTTEGLEASGSSDEIDFALIDQLSDRLGVENLDVRFARDEGGSEVMYIQLN